MAGSSPKKPVTLRRRPQVHLGDVDAGDRNGAVGTDELPAVANELVMDVDAGDAPEGVPGVVRVHEISRR
jgi:hypothetical protein